MNKETYVTPWGEFYEFCSEGMLCGSGDSTFTTETWDEVDLSKM